MISTDRDVLLVLYRSTGGENWRSSDKWCTDADLSQWYGVTVDDEGRVVELFLGGNSLRGPIPSELGELDALRKLNFDSNKLSGPIPPEMGKLGTLQYFRLDSNELSGPIPATLGNLAALEHLSLSGNKLSGPIPKELGALAELTHLRIGATQISGHIPKEIGALGKLQELWLFSNKLSGPIPPELGNLGALEWLSINKNQLSGHIPPELGNMAAVQLFHIDGNQLSGPIPAALGALVKLKRLHLFDNQLTGPIPQELGALTELQEFRLNGNQLSGIPPDVLELCRGQLQEPSWGSNRWSRPPATVLESGFESALGWWGDVNRFGEGRSNRLKMVLVGLAEAGKTTIVRHLTGRSVPQQSDRTVGIEITPDWRPLDAGPLQVSVWDFAGQADYYSSHQLFLTKGSLFLLVVDLRAFSMEVEGGVDNFTDPRGRIYWWLEMLQMRVPGAAVALVGSHVDQMESSDVDLAVTRFRTVVRKFIEDKKENASKGKVVSPVDTQSTTPMEADHPQRDEQTFGNDDNPALQSGSSDPPAAPLVLHDHVFMVSLKPVSVRELREWVVRAASGRECPGGFSFPAVDQIVPKAWQEAYDAMDVVKGTMPCVLWSEAVEKFSSVMSASPHDAADPGEVLLRAMQHREAEGGVLLSLADASAPAATDMLHLDPSWLIELVRRLADHNLVDECKRKQGTIKEQLRKYAKEQQDDLEPLWDMHGAYCKSGHLDEKYLRFLWTYRKINPPGPAVNLTRDEFKSIVSTMVRLLVMYRARGRGDFVVPARLPEYGDQRVLDPENVVEIVVVTKCSFNQVYPPPGIVGRFLAWLTQVDDYGECWQHGAFVSYKYHKVFFFESEDDERHESGTDSKFAGLTLGVQGQRPDARQLLEELKTSLRQLVLDSAYGYPGLAALISFEEPVETRSEELLALRSLLDNIGDRLERIEQKLDGVANQLTEQVVLAASVKREECPYPRLIILVPDAEEYEAHGRIQHTGWDQWRKAWKRLHGSVEFHQEFRLRFLCEYSLTEVPCGPDGRGYLIKKPKAWVKECIPLVQASLWVLRLAVGFVSNVDLPLNEVLGAAVEATGAALVDGLDMELPGTTNADGLPALGKDVSADKVQEFRELQGPAYESICKFMRETEASAPRRWLGCPPCHRQPGPLIVRWKDSMVQERNRSGGWAWVLKKHQEAYVTQNRGIAASAASARSPIS